VLLERFANDHHQHQRVYLAVWLYHDGLRHCSVAFALRDVEAMLQGVAEMALIDLDLLYNVKILQNKLSKLIYSKNHSFWFKRLVLAFRLFAQNDF
jgi:hypothetical protein